MERPELKDFDLDDKQVKEYCTQSENFVKAVNEAKKKNSEIKEKRKKTDSVAFGVAIALWFVVVIIVGFVFGSKAETEKGLSGGDMFWSVVWFVASFFIAWGGYKICIANSESYNTDIVEVDKYKHINKGLEEKVKKYREATKEYEEYTNLKSRIYWEDLSPFEFEKQVKELYERLGYEAYLTRKTADGGVDVILRKNGKKYAVQCKHYKTPVSPAPVRELRGVLGAEYDEGIFISLSGYTQGVYEENSGRVHKKIKLLTLKDLIEMTEKSYTLKEKSVGKMQTSDIGRDSRSANDKKLDFAREIMTAYELAEWEPVFGNNKITGIGYHEETSILFVTFSGGVTYAYEKVGLNVYESFCKSELKDVYFDNNIKDQYNSYIDNEWFESEKDE